MEVFGRRRMTMGLSLAILLMGAAQSRAGTLYGNLGAGFSFDQTAGYLVDGANLTDQVIAQAFMVADAAIVSDVQVAVGFYSGSVNPTLMLQADSGGAPSGVALDTLKLDSSSTIGPFGPGNLAQFNCTVCGPLAAGTVYWVVMLETDADSGLLWNLNDINDLIDHNIVFNNSGSSVGPWTLGDVTDVRAAMQIDGSAVPEPDYSLFVGLFAILVACLARVRHSSARMGARRAWAIVGISILAVSELPAQSQTVSVWGGNNPKKVALLQWFVNQTGNFPLDFAPFSVAFDGSSIWVGGQNALAKLRTTDGTVLGRFFSPGDGDGVAFDGVNMWVSSGSAHTVTKLQANDGTVLGTFTVAYAHKFAFDGANVWVASYPIGNAVTKLRASDGAVLGTFPVPSPYGIAFDGANIWVANLDANTVTKLRASDGSLLGAFNAGSKPRDVAFDGANLWISSYDANTVTKVRTSDGNTLATLNVNSPIGLAFDGSSIWVANHGRATVTQLRAADGANLGTFPTRLQPWGVAFDGANIWVANFGGGSVSKL